MLINIKTIGLNPRERVRISIFAWGVYPHILTRATTRRRPIYYLEEAVPSTVICKALPFKRDSRGLLSITRDRDNFMQNLPVRRHPAKEGMKGWYQAVNPL